MVWKSARPAGRMRGFHFSWCPTQQDDVLDIPPENVYNQTIDEEVELLLEDEDL